jgi:hypothetical protein
MIDGCMEEKGDKMFAKPIPGKLIETKRGIPHEEP